MAQPTPYNRVGSFTTIQQNAPTAPIPGSTLDAELNAIKTTLDGVLNNLVLIQRDDGELANLSVGRDQIDSSITLGFNAPSAWVTGKNYTSLDTTFFGGAFYRCKISHISGVFATDLAALKWELISDFSASLANAINVGFTPAANIVATNTQHAIEEVVSDLTTIINGVRTPEYLVGALSGELSAERLVTNTATVSWDVTVAGTAKANVVDLSITAAKLAADAVETAKILNRNVTIAKIQAINTGKLLGRTTAAAGDIEEITPSAKLSLAGGTLGTNLTLPTRQVLTAGAGATYNTPAGARLLKIRMVGGGGGGGGSGGNGGNGSATTFNGVNANGGSGGITGGGVELQGGLGGFGGAGAAQLRMQGSAGASGGGASSTVNVDLCGGVGGAGPFGGSGQGASRGSAGGSAVANSGSGGGGGSSSGNGGTGGGGSGEYVELLIPNPAGSYIFSIGAGGSAGDGTGGTAGGAGGSGIIIVDEEYW